MSREKFARDACWNVETPVEYLEQIFAWAAAWLQHVACDKVRTVHTFGHPHLRAAVDELYSAYSHTWVRFLSRP